VSSLTIMAAFVENPPKIFKGDFSSWVSTVGKPLLDSDLVQEIGPPRK